jgi:SAM-dependent methyltransferase
LLPVVDEVVQRRAKLILPPGTILQHMYVRERMRRLPPGTFIEVGCGRGTLSKLLLDLGWCGRAYDLNPAAVDAALRLNANAVSEHRYEAHVADWLTIQDDGLANIVVSSMVLEHLTENAEAAYFERARAVLGSGGLAVLLVPANPRAWGIEDDVAGHLRRYTADGLDRRVREFGWEQVHVTGLTYPLSNLLLPLSNMLVKRAEGHKRSEDMAARTQQSGTRDVPLKTQFPALAAVILNDWALYPFHLLQKANRRNRRSLVLYAEVRPRHG